MTPAPSTTRWSPVSLIDFPASIDRYTRWGNDLATVVHEGRLIRVSASDDPYAVAQVTEDTIEVSCVGDVEQALNETKFRFAESLDRTSVVSLGKRVSSVGEQLGRLPGYRPPMNGAVYESLVGSICAQQVNLTWAATTRGRLVERYGVQHEFNGVTVWKFPHADVVAEADPLEIRAMQFTTRKSEYIIEAARAVASGELDGLADASDEEVIRRITAVRGLGRWTAEWFLARTLARSDAIAAGDLGVRKAISRFVADVDENLPESDIRHITADWGDGGNWATHLLLERLAD